MDLHPPLSSRHRWVVAAMVALVGLMVFLFLFERQDRFDYHPTACRAGPHAFSVSLNGSFAPGSDDRTSPYYLRLQLDDGADQHMRLTAPTLVSMESAAVTQVPEVRHSLVTVEGNEVFVMVSSPMELAYDDYALTGSIRTGTEGGLHRLSCNLTRNRNSQWRLPLWETLMSA